MSNRETRGVTNMPLLSEVGAEIVLAAALDEARRNGWSVAIAVADPAGDLLAFRRMEGTPPSSAYISMAKAATAARIRASSKLLQDRVEAGQNGLLAIPGLVPLQGGVPITVDGIVIGALGVSGAKGHEDAQVSAAGAAAIGSV